MRPRKVVPFIDWGEKNVILDNDKPIHFEKHQRKILQKCFWVGKDGRLQYSTIIYSCPKKSGKTAILAIAVLWFAYELAPKTEIILAANDLEQSTGRAFKEVKKIINRSPVLKSRVTSMTAREIVLNDGTTIKAIPVDAAGEAGANQSFAGFDELWGYVSERSRRLWDELTPVPTQLNSIRFVTTYAGYSGESDLLEELYAKGKKGKRIWPLLPVWVTKSMFFYWDTKGRMPWQTPAYYAAQKEELRPIAYDRLHNNKWVNSESGLFEMEKWDACVDRKHRPPLPDKRLRLFVGVDASVKKDRSAVVSTYQEEGLLKLGPKQFWQPSKKEPMDFEETMEAYLLELHQNYRLVSVKYDPYQFHRSATTLKKKGLPMVEYAQSVPNLTTMGQNLFDLVEFNNIVLYPCNEMRKEAAVAIAKDTGRGLQIVKSKSSHKIDQIVALAMASVDMKGKRVIPRVAITGHDPHKRDVHVEKPEIKFGEQLIEIWEGDRIVGYEVKPAFRGFRRGISIPSRRGGVLGSIFK